MSRHDGRFGTAKARSFIVWPRAALSVADNDRGEVRGNGHRDDRRALATLRGKTVLVTGASSGIGRATAELVGSHGAHVLALARSVSALDEVVATIAAAGGNAESIVCDLADPDQVAAALARLADYAIDGVVSNAGLSVHRSVAGAAEHRDLERSLGVNVTGPAQLLLGLAPRMIASGGGTIVNVSTVSAKPPPAPRWGSYQSTKTAFDIWLRSAALEWRNDGITVRSVYMPLVATPMTASGGLYPTAPALHANEAAMIVAEALVRGRNRIAPWWLVWQDLAATAFPAVFDRILRWQARR